MRTLFNDSWRAGKKHSVLQGFRNVLQASLTDTWRRNNIGLECFSELIYKKKVKAFPKKAS
jgi:hypothetical protein